MGEEVHEGNCQVVDTSYAMSALHEVINTMTLKYTSSTKILLVKLDLYALHTCTHPHTQTFFHKVVRVKGMSWYIYIYFVIKWIKYVYACIYVCIFGSIGRAHFIHGGKAETAYHITVGWPRFWDLEGKQVYFQTLFPLHYKPDGCALRYCISPAFHFLCTFIVWTLKGWQTFKLLARIKWKHLCLATHLIDCFHSHCWKCHLEITSSKLYALCNYLPDYSHIIPALSVRHTRSVCFVKAAKCILKENKSNINSACTNLREHYGTVGVTLMPLLAPLESNVQSVRQILNPVIFCLNHCIPFACVVFILSFVIASIFSLN